MKKFAKTAAKIGYSDGSQQVMAVNLQSGDVTFRPIVGGN